MSIWFARQSDEKHGRWNFCGTRCSSKNPYPAGTQLHTLYAFLSKNRRWVHMRTLNTICYRYGARILELRNDGAIIEKKHGDKNAYYYRCTRLPHPDQA